MAEGVAGTEAVSWGWRAFDLPGSVRLRYLLGVGTLAAAYYGAAKLGYVLEFTRPVAALVWLPAGVAQAPGQLPGWKTIGSVVALGVPGTALAYLLFFGLITGAGAAYTSLVTYLIPPIALAYGAIFLGERFGASAFGGLALILAGVALGTGAVRFKRARQPQPADG